MGFTKPELLYGYDALEPHIDAETMQIHHQKHHTAYVTGLSKLSDSSAGNADLHRLLMDLCSNDGLSGEDKTTLLQHGGGHYNHSLFWEYMTPQSSTEQMSSLVRERIDKDFGSLDGFKDAFDKAASGVFGSGWCWWVYDCNLRKSEIMTTKDQMNPIMNCPKKICLLGLDVWEHAYYLKFHNLKGKYIEAWWNVVNWDIVSKIHDNLAINGKQVALNKDGYIQFDM